VCLNNSDFGKSIQEPVLLILWMNEFQDTNIPTNKFVEMNIARTNFIHIVAHCSTNVI
jgi:hypothetical protein